MKELHFVRLKRVDLPTDLVDINEDDAALLKRGLVALQSEIKTWMRPKTLRIFPQKNPHAEAGTRRLDEIDALIERLDAVGR